MKKLCLLILIALCFNCYAQNKKFDSLRHVLNIAKTDSARAAASLELVYHYVETNRDSALNYIERYLLIAKRNNMWYAEGDALEKKAHQLIGFNKYAEALGCLQLSFRIADDPENRKKKTWSKNNGNSYQKVRVELLNYDHLTMGELMAATGDTVQAVIHYKTAASLAEERGDKFALGLATMTLGGAYGAMGKVDSALLLEKKAELYLKQSGIQDYMGYCYVIAGHIHLYAKHDAKSFLQDFHLAIAIELKNYNFSILSIVYAGLANYYIDQQQADSSLYYSKKELESRHNVGAIDLGDTYEHLYKSYELRHKTDSAYKYLGLALDAKNSSFKATAKSLADFQKLSYKAQIHAQELEKEKAAAETRIRTYALFAGIAVFMLLAGILYRNNRKEKKAKNILHDKNVVIEQTLNHLKSAQTQLIQSEKMASLGELTAGIAHEIQNPLNFVNNFSDVNREMLTELQQELDKGDINEAKSIAADIEQNEQKINHHGKRAEAIVKGMLEHSRSSTGQKEPTDINQLADEYIRLSYHGLRAKDKSFNAELITNFDLTIPKVNAIPQDIGRVLLNLFNNAFYAVNQKAKTAGTDYKPEVSVTTSAENGQVIIKVKDNGIGIPEAIKEKIMQPFFTTKPTGEGTGLGLSLTYDMVVKGHGGTIDIDSKEGIYTIFTITLPVI